VPAPLFLSQIRKNHWLQALPDRHAIFVQVNNILPDEDETMPQFGLRLRQAIADGKPRHLILDLRHNNGGNSFSYIELLRTLVAFSAGEGQKVYVLIGRNVYSAAANLSTDLERLVRPVFVGEPTSGTGNQWGDENRFILPYSGLTGAFSGVRWQLSNPWDERRSIVPQVPVQLTAGDYFAGRDPALDAVFRLIREI
jgi:C-terminal processing protease CtpA/Prc